MTPRALDGIRILDFTRVLAGPLCTMILADLGADVIKVEHPQGGDDTREWGPPWVGEGTENRQSAYFLSVNRNKRSLTLDLKREAGRELARQLARESQIVIENFKIGQMDAFGLGFEHLRALNPALVFCSITGYGQTGAYSPRPGYDYVVQAMSGLMSITGASEGEPHKVGVAISDVIAGLYAANAVQAALHHAQRTGEGQRVDIALLDTQISALVNVASNYLISGTPPARYGNQHANIVPYQTFRASDRDLVVAVGNDKQFATLCDLIQHSEWREDPRFATNPARVENREALIPLLDTVFATRTADEWVDLLLSAGIPAGPINDIPTALHDPHVLSRGMVQNVTLSNGEDVRLVGSPLHLSATPSDVRYPPPALGEHTDAILSEVLKLSPEQIAEYRRLGAV